MPQIDLSILNQRQTPAFYADTLANRPAAGFIGRIFVSTNTFELYRDNGTSWDLIGGPGAGTVTGSGAAGQVAFWNAASTITGSNDLFWDNVNGHLGIGTNTPGTALGINHNQNQIIQLNQTTATNDTKIAFQNSGTPLWRIGNSYNAAANDFGIFDVVGAFQPVTIKKTTGQTFIGPQQTSSGKLVVVATSRDNGIILIGTNAPGFRINDGTEQRQVGIAMSTGANDFIQGSVDRDFCIFNASKAAPSPMLFGIHDTGANFVIEAARISPARNFLIGSTIDSGEKLQVNGTSNLNGNLTISGNTRRINALFSGGPAIDRTHFQNITTNSDTFVGFLPNGTGNSAGVQLYNNSDPTNSTGLFLSATLTALNIQSLVRGTGVHLPIQSYTSGVVRTSIETNGNFLIGTTTDAGYKILVNGSGYFAGEGIFNYNINGYSTVSIANNATAGAGVGSQFLLIDGTTQVAWFRRNRDGSGTNELTSTFGDTLFKTGATPTTRMTIKSTGIINMLGLPTSAAGLSSGDVYSNLGILTIVP
jgi:hypothetical protein